MGYILFVISIIAAVLCFGAVAARGRALTPAERLQEDEEQMAYLRETYVERRMRLGD